MLQIVVICYSLQLVSVLVVKLIKSKVGEASISGMVIALAALGLILDDSWIKILVVSGAVCAVFLAVVAEKTKIKFERSYTCN